MNASKLISDVQLALEKFVGVEMGNVNFFIIGAIGLVAVLILGRTFSVSVGQSQRNMLVIFVALLIPLVTVLISYSIGQPILEEQLDNPDLSVFLGTIGAVLVGIVIAFIVSRPILRMSALGIVATAFLTYGVAFALMYGSRVVLESVNSAAQGDVQWKDEWSNRRSK